MDGAQGRQLPLQPLLLPLQARELPDTCVCAPAGAAKHQQKTTSAVQLAVTVPLQGISAATAHEPPQYLQHMPPR